MTTPIDFLHAPGRRRRARERLFYGWLATATLLGSLSAGLLALRLHLHTRDLLAASTLLDGQVRALAPQVQASTALRADIERLEKRNTALRQLAQQRAQAAQLLRGVATASDTGMRLQRISLQDGRADLSGQAPTMQAIQDYAGALSGAGLEGATLHDLHADQQPDATGGYAFSLTIPLPPTATETRR
ncbi:pilus assembly protein [Herbaspirillum sp. NPDC087042]|uniref:pilus assembly protein n=1 Tax=Herbaspirillum sp. NPDC087042 TaxID=3364004 RepID=UPI00380C106D